MGRKKIIKTNKNELIEEKNIFKAENILILDNVTDEKLLMEIFGLHNYQYDLKCILTLKEKLPENETLNLFAMREYGIILKNDDKRLFIPWSNIISLELKN